MNHFIKVISAVLIGMLVFSSEYIILINIGDSMLVQLATMQMEAGDNASVYNVLIKAYPIFSMVISAISGVITTNLVYKTRRNEK